MFADIKTNKSAIDKIIQTYNPDFIFAPKGWFKPSQHSERYNLELLSNYELFREANNKSILIYPELSLLLPTSGSLGDIKYVRLSHDNLESNTKSIVEYLRITQNDRAITTMPIGYSFMLSIINSHLAVGASIVICDHSIVEQGFWEAAKLHRITSLSGVPMFFQILCRIFDREKSIPSLRQVTQAGGKLENNLAKKMIALAERQNFEFITMYGQTEASPRISYLEWKQAKHKIGSIGKAIPDVDMWLESENGERVTSPHREGEIIVSGRNICLGYAEGADDLTRGDENHGQIRTGDLGKKDADGYFFITGRLKRIAKIDGFRINLDDIEQKMKAENINIACIEGQNKIKVFFEHSVETSYLIQKLYESTNQKKSIFSCIQIETLPFTANGKLDYRKLSELHDA